MLQRIAPPPTTRPPNKPPNKHRLNDRFIGDLLPKDGPYLVWDTMQHGLAVRVQPTGHKSFKVIYRRNDRCLADKEKLRFDLG